MQLLTQVFCSPLHFIGSADAACAPSKNSPKAAIDIALIIMLPGSR
jgi:hypothetical protein